MARTNENAYCKSNPKKVTKKANILRKRRVKRGNQSRSLAQSQNPAVQSVKLRDWLVRQAASEPTGPTLLKRHTKRATQNKNTPYL
jgi:hypothetical protein